MSMLVGCVVLGMDICFLLGYQCHISFKGTTS